MLRYHIMVIILLCDIASFLSPYNITVYVCIRKVLKSHM